jgi:molybdopterin-containing oxidoreductase family membrane subunit
MFASSSSNWPFFLFGFLFGWTTSATTLLCLVAIARRRRFLLASIATLSRIIIVTGALCSIAYVLEASFAFFGGNIYERYAYQSRLTGWGSVVFWIQIAGVVVVPQLFWLRRARSSPWLALALCLGILGPMYLEKAIVFITAWAQPEFLPSSWR